MHRHFTHSLVMAPVIGVAAAWLVCLWQRWRKQSIALRPLIIAGVVAAFSHAFCDVWTSYGTRWFWPFSDQRVSWDWISVIDPLFTLPLLPLVLLGVWKRSRSFVVAGLLWATVYLGFCAIQKHRVLVAASELAEQRGHVMERLTVKPSFANIIVWRALYETEGRAEVMCFRAGQSVELLGESRTALVRLENLTDVPPQSVLANDIKRFAHFSDDWLAWHPEQPGILGDMRYALRPDAVSPLWGITVDLARADEHVRFLSFRSTRDESWAILWQMIRGTEKQKAEDPS
jgi:inner membrane protein